MNTDEASLLDFARPYKFDTTFKEDGVEHTYMYGRQEDLAVGNLDVEKLKDRSSELWLNIRFIGDGGFSSVWMQKETPSGETRAVKKIFRNRTAGRSLSRELRSLIEVRNCEHIVRFFGWYESPDFYFIAMEYAEHGDLNQYLKNMTSKPATEHAKSIIYQILKGLAVLHSKDICHRDLKPQNVLITSLQPIHIKIADFGISKCFRDTELRTLTGTSGYLAPELLGTIPQRFRSNESHSYTKAVDIWALGCLVYNILTLEAPFLAPASTEIETTTSTNGSCQRELDLNLLCQYCNGENHILASSLQKLGVAEREIVFVNRLLVIDPKSRISAANALMDPWFSQSSHTRDLLPSGSPKETQNIDHQDKDSALIEASRVGHMELVSAYLWAGANIQGRDNKGKTSLHLAATNGHYDTVRFLLEHGANLDAADWYGLTALHLAASVGHKAVARLLVEKGADLSAVDSDGWTPLHQAASYGHKVIVQFLLESGADLSVVDSSGQTALHLAASHGHEAIARILLEKGADVSAVGSQRFTALHLAALGGHEAVAQLLLERGADVSAVGSDGWTPLHQAASYGHKAIVQFLLERGADLSGVDSSGQTALHLAAPQGHVAVVRILLENGADLSVVDSSGQTALHLTASQGHEEVARILLEKGADVSAVGSQRFTALHLAALGGHEAVARLLLEKGADVSAVGSERSTALHSAALGGNEAVARLFLEKSMNVSALDASGLTPLHRAASHGHSAVIQLFLENGANLSAVDWYGQTPLHLAALGGSAAAVGLLIEKGADVRAIENKGKTPLDLAMNSDCEKLLSRALRISRWWKW